MGRVEDFYRTLMRCLGCGVCRAKADDACPMWLGSSGFEAETPRGIITIALDLLDGSISLTKELSNVFYECSMCSGCVIRCGATDEKGAPLIDVPEVVVALREKAVEEGVVPSKVRDFLENVQRYGNPYGEGRHKRRAWAEGLGVREYRRGDELLYYVGCVASHDPRGRAIARAMASTLSKAGASFGVLSDESCCGGEVLRLGEVELFKLLAEENSRKFEQLGVARVVTTCPHGYYTMRSEYPKLGANVEVSHHTQLLRELVDGGRLRFSREVRAVVAYHDPCFLGRRGGEYEAPRQVLSNIPGVRLVELERSRERSLCCGGGGGNFYTGMLGGEGSSSRLRVREAYEAGAEVLATACPMCAIMLEDALKDEGLEGRLRVRDVVEIVAEAMGP